MLVGTALTAVLAGAVAVAPAANATLPIAAKVAPAAAQPGHGITLSGDLLTGAESVTFLGSDALGDEVAAPVFQVLNPKTLFVQVPDGAVSGAVRVTTPAGSGTTPAAVAVLNAPSIDGLSVSVAKGKDVVTVTGTYLGGKRKVFIAGKAAGILEKPVAAGTNVTQLSVVVPGGLPGGPTSLVVTNEGGTDSTPFYIAPEVKAVSPKAGSTVGGGVAVVTGSAFTGAESVLFGGVPSPKVLQVSDKELVVRVPAGAAGAAPVVVRTVDGARSAESTSPVSYLYQPIPTVTSMTPNWHPVSATASDAPGPEVVLSGANLTDATAVLFGTTAVTPVVDAVAGTLAFTPPVSLKPAVVNVTLVNTVGGVAYKSVVPFGYVQAPTVTKLVPPTGPPGTTVVVSGTGFTAESTATFGGAAASCTVVSFVALRCTAPAGSGAAAVQVTTPVGTGPAASAPAVSFTYATGALPAPVVKKLVPAMGLPGSVVSVAGANMHLVTAVAFPGAGGSWVDAPEFLTVAPGRLVVRVPEGALSGMLRFSRAVGTPVTSGLVRYLAVARPSVSSIDAVGLATVGVVGGDTLVLRGAGLRAGAVLPFVTVGGLPASVLKSPVPTAAAVAVKVPASMGRQAEVVVRTPFGVTTAAVQAYYVPQVKAAKLAATLPDGRGVVLVSGLGFTGASSYSQGSGRLSAVTFGGVPSEQVVVLSDKQLVAVAPVGSHIVDGIEVSTQHGAWVGRSDDTTRALVLPVPAVSGFTPALATLASAAPQVTLTGSNLGSDSVVEFGGQPATFVSAAADGTSMVVVPPMRTTTTSVTVTVTNNVNGEPHTVAAADPFRYVPVPSITSVTPGAGWTGSQQPDVTIAGRNLRQSTVVRFGGVQVPVTSASADGTSLTASPPVRNDVGAVDVTVTNFVDAEQFTAELVGGYGYSLNTATVTGLSATTALPGTPVTVRGTSFVGVTSVRFGSTAVPFTVADSDTLYVTVPVTPASLHGTSVAVSVTNGTGTASTGGPAWTWDSRPAITGMSVSTGASGSTVTLTGTGFTGTTAVKLASIAASGFTVVDDTTLQVVVPVTPSLGTVANVSVVARGLTSPEPVDVTANDWTWAPIAVVSSVAPSPVAAGATVTVTGQHFTPGQAVWIQLDLYTKLDVTTALTVAPDGTSFTFAAPARPQGYTKGPYTLHVTNSSGAKSKVSGSNSFSWA